MPDLVAVVGPGCRCAEPCDLVRDVAPGRVPSRHQVSTWVHRPPAHQEVNP